MNLVPFTTLNYADIIPPLTKNKKIREKERAIYYIGYSLAPGAVSEIFFVVDSPGIFYVSNAAPVLKYNLKF